jgi:hypothetical protein
MTWEIIWMLIILKIPVIYLSCVVWWAIRSVPEPLEPALKTAPVDPERRPGWRFARLRPRRPGRGPHGTPTRGYREKTAQAQAKLPQ